MELQIIPFRARHVTSIAPLVSDEMKALATMAQTQGRGFTGCILGEPVGCAGIVVQRAGMGEAWALFSPILKTMPLSLYRAVKRGMDEIVLEMHLTKLYAVVEPGDERAANFMRHLGFEMKKHLYYREVR